MTVLVGWYGERGGESEIVVRDREHRTLEKPAETQQPPLPCPSYSLQQKHCRPCCCSFPLHTELHNTRRHTYTLLDPIRIVRRSMAMSVLATYLILQVGALGSVRKEEAHRRQRKEDDFVGASLLWWDWCRSGRGGERCISAGLGGMANETVRIIIIAIFRRMVLAVCCSLPRVSKTPSVCLTLLLLITSPTPHPQTGRSSTAFVFYPTQAAAASSSSFFCSSPCPRFPS